MKSEGCPRTDGVSWLMRASGVLVAALLLAVTGLEAQETGTITGRVEDARNGQPIGSVQIYIAGLDIGVLTQQNGRYLLQNVPAGTHTLTAERIGYQTVTEEVSVSAEETAVQNFTISEEALQLDEVVVTGTPGGTQRRALGNSLTDLEAADVTEQVAVSNMQEMLTGRTPGLQYTRLGGNVGAGSPLQIRGVGSFNLSANPLIYVDGIRVDNSSSAGPTIGEGQGEANVLDDFNPQEIESIEVIKGPAAATLYGTEASAGVIQIITKKGEEGDAQFSASIRQGTNFMTDPAGRLGQQWTCANSFSPPCEEGDLVPYNMYEEANKYITGEQPGPDGGQYFEWPTNNLFQYGHTQSYNLDIRGGTESIRYYVSGNYENEEGIVWYNNDETFRLRGNLSVVFTENLSIDFSTGYVDGFTRFAQPVSGDGGLWQDLVWSNGFCLVRLNQDACPRLGGFQEHLPSDVANVEATRDYSRFTGSASVNFTYGDWLTQRAVIGIDKGWDENTSLFPLATENPVYGETAEGEMTLSRPINTNTSLEYSATADFDVTEAWGSATSVGGQYYIKTQNSFSNHGVGFPTPVSRTINQTPPARTTTDYELVENKSLGLYVQEEVSWNDRVFVTGAIRFDDNSAFGADFEAETYPKLSATWVISEESFWNIDAVNSLRLRGAWGQAGRQPDAFAGSNQYAVVPGPSGTGAVIADRPGNPEVGPETSSELELGFDYALLEDRLSGEFTYFSQKNDDALLSVPIAPSAGFAGNTERNLGRIDNWGWEVSMDARIYQSQDLTFDLRLSGDHTDNEIKSLGDFPGSTSVRIGMPYPNLTTDYRVVDAEYNEAGEVTDAHGRRIRAFCDAGVPLGEDHRKYGVELGGPTKPCTEVADLDLLVGPAYFTHTAQVAPRISLLNNALTIHALAEGQYGKIGDEANSEWGHIYNNSKISRTEDDPLWVAGDRWDDELYKPAFDADFWKLREVGVRYRLPESLVARAGVDRASLNVSGRNLWIIWRAQEEIWGRQISDPEYGSASNVAGQSGHYTNPPLSSVSATLRVTF